VRVVVLGMAASAIASEGVKICQEIQFKY
jgi:hypothetical protein